MVFSEHLEMTKKLMFKTVIFFLLASVNLRIVQQVSADNDNCTTIVVCHSEKSEVEKNSSAVQRNEGFSSAKSEKGDPVLPAEHRLYNYLLGEKSTINYLKQLRPVNNYKSQIVINFGICLMSIDDIIERDQSMISTGCIKMKWKDDFLTWNPADFDNLTWIILPSDKIWIPDIAMVNSPDPFSMSKNQFSKVELSYDGQVGYYPTGRFQTRCPIMLDYFPFDEQICEYHFESWAYPHHQVKVVLWSEQPIDQKGYVSNHQWELEKTNTKTELRNYEGIEFDALTFQFFFRRRSLYYTVYAIVPGFLMACLQLISMTLPLEHPGRMGLLTALFIGFKVLQGNIAISMPKSSDSVSLVQVYLMICSLTLVLSIVQTAVNMHVFFRTPDHSEAGVCALLKSFFILFGIKPAKKNFVCSMPSKPSVPLLGLPKRESKFDMLRFWQPPALRAALPRSLVQDMDSENSTNDMKRVSGYGKSSKSNVRHQWLLFAAKFDRVTFYVLALLHLISPIYLFGISPLFQEYHATSDLGYMAHEHPTEL